MSIFNAEITFQSLPDGKTLIAFGEKQYRLNNASIALLQSLQNNDDIESAYKDFSRTDFSEKINIDLFRILSTRLLQRLHSPSATKLIFPWLWAKFNIIPEELACYIVIRFQFLFKPRVFLSVLFSVSTLLLYFFLFKPLHGFDRIFPVSTIVYIAICFITLLWHELGHLSACAAYKIPHKGIDGGMFLFIPATFVEMRNIWQAKKFQRICINFAGVYFQLLLAGSSIVIYLISLSNLALNVAAVSISMSIFQLIPFRNSDGYWIILDTFFKGTDQVFGHQKSLIEKHELRMPERTIRFLGICFMFGFMAFLFYRNIPSAKAAILQIELWLWMVQMDGFSLKDIAVIKVRDLASLIFAVVGTLLLVMFSLRRGIKILHFITHKK